MKHRILGNKIELKPSIKISQKGKKLIEHASQKYVFRTNSFYMILNFGCNDFLFC